jgi:hypothetical protein
MRAASSSETAVPRPIVSPMGWLPTGAVDPPERVGEGVAVPAGVADAAGGVGPPKTIRIPGRPSPTAPAIAARTRIAAIATRTLRRTGRRPIHPSKPVRRRGGGAITRRWRTRVAMSAPAPADGG